VLGRELAPVQVPGRELAPVQVPGRELVQGQAWELAQGQAQHRH